MLLEHNRQVITMTKLPFRRLAALSTLLLLTMTALAAGVHAGAANPGSGEPVSGAQDVNWRELSDEAHLYLVRQNETDRVDALEGQTQTSNVGQLSTERPNPPEVRGQSAVDIAQLDPFVVRDPDVTGALDNPQTTAKFQTDPLARPVTIRGSNVMETNIKVIATPNLNWTIRILDCASAACNPGETTVVGKDTFRPKQPDSPLQGFRANFSLSRTIPFADDSKDVLGEHSYRFAEGHHVRVEVFAEPGTVDLEILPTETDQIPSRYVWLLRREGPSGQGPLDGASKITLHTEGSLEVTGWIEDTEGRVSSIFTNHTDDTEDDIDARFAIRSAFGIDDVDSATASFELKRFNPATSTNETFLMGDQDNKSVQLDEAPGLENPDDGQVGWKLPERFWNYDQAPPGKYKAVMSADNVREAGGSSSGLSRTWNFRLTDQATQVRMFEGDQNTHLLQPGSSTTFLVRVLNAGSTEDTFDLSVQFPAAAQQGWTAEVEAPGLKASNELPLKPGESTLARVTVSAPEGTPLGTSQSFTFNASSSIDEKAFDEIALIATTSNEVRHDVGIIPAGQEADVTMGPKENKTSTLYIWNNATVSNDVNIGLRRSAQLDKWNVTLQGQGAEGDGFTVQGVPPGDVATVDVRFRTKGDLTTLQNNVIINASIAGLPETRVELDVTADVELRDNVDVDILNAIGDLRWRFLEMECPGTTQLTCPSDTGIPRLLGGTATEEDIDTDSNDAIDATYFRTWVTNTGDTEQTFELKIRGANEVSINDVEPYRCNFAFKPIPETAQAPSTNPNDLPPSVGTGDVTGLNPRQQSCAVESDGSTPPAFDANNIWPPATLRKFSDNKTSPVARIPDLGAGETAEYYVRVLHRTNAFEYATTKLKFSVVADCVDCPAEGRDEIRVRGENGVEEKSDVLVEPVARLPGYNEGPLPLVEIENQTQETLSKSFLPGQQDFVDYKVRVTHGGTYADTNEESKVTVDLVGIESQGGWDAKLQPVTTRAETNLGFRESYTFDTACTGEMLCQPTGSGTGHASYQDTEFRVRVFPPDPAEENNDDKLLAGESSSVIVKANGVGFQGTDSVILKTEVESVPELRLEAGTNDEPITPGDRTAFLLKLRNIGSSRGTFSFHTKAPAGWTASPAHENFTIEAQTSRSIPLRVSAPDGIEKGREVEILAKSTWDDQVPRDWTNQELRCNSAGEPVNPEAPVACELVTVRVVQEGVLKITPEAGTSSTMRPGGQQIFKFALANNADSRDIGVNLEVVASEDWTAQLSRNTFTGESDLDAGENRSVNLVVRAPNDVIQGSSHAFVVKAQGTGNEDNVALQTFTADIIEGTARPVVQVNDPKQLVERGSFVTYEIEVENRGSAKGTFPLRVDGPSRQDWTARIHDRTGLPVQEVTLFPNQQQTVFVNVSAPFEDVNVGTVVKPTFIARSNFQSQESASVAQATLTARIQDYGVDLQLPDTNVKYIPGTRAEVPFKLTNTGNGNDTLNVSMSLQGLENTWQVTFDESSVRLEPGESETVEAEIRSPREPLPSSRTVTFTAWAGTERGAEVNQWHNRSVPFVVDILEYRSQDVDGDNFVELAVDTTPADPTDGYPHYREIFPQGRNATLRAIFDGDQDGKPDFLLDDPGEGGIDGIADIYWDPDDIVVSRIVHRPDVDYDESPDYLVDADGDDIADAFWNSGNRTRGDVDAIQLEDNGPRSYVIDSEGDGAFDKYFDPASDLVSEADADTGQGPNVVGLDTTGDGDTDTYYDTEDESLEAATFQNAGQFAQDYWYLVVLFVLVLAVGVYAVHRR